MYILQFTTADVSMAEPVHQMEREPYEVLYDFYFYFLFLHEVLYIYIYIYIYSHSFLKHQILMFKYMCIVYVGFLFTG